MIKSILRRLHSGSPSSPPIPARASALPTLALAAAGVVGGLSFAHADTMLPIHEYQAENTFNDSISPLSANGSPFGGVSFTTGQSGLAFNFNGNQYINLGIPGSLAGTMDFAVSAWIETTYTGGQTIIQQRDANIDAEYILNISSNHNGGAYYPGHVYFLLTGPGGGVLQEFWSNATVTDGHWHLIRVLRTGGTIKMFIDGNVDSTYTFPGTVQMLNHNGTYIGKDVRDGNKPFVGQIDDVKIEKLIVSPVVNAGGDQTVNEGAAVTLSGAISDPNNVPQEPVSSYAWTQLSGPAVALNGANSLRPSFTAPAVPRAGAALSFQLSATNRGGTTISKVTVNVANVNNPPVAKAGADQTVGESTVVTLDGSQSSDADGDPLTLHWTQVAGVGPTVQLVNADTANPTFTAPSVTAAQGTVDLQFQLVANDGQVDSGPSIVTVHVKNTNDAPIANAGANQSVNELDPVTLDGSASSDPDNDPLTYSWKQILGTPVVTLSGADTASPSFQAPELKQGGAAGGTTLTFELTVNDGKVSGTSTVNVSVNNVNHAPLADAGKDQTVPSKTLVTLDGSNSADVDGDALTYSWVQTGGPGVTLSGTDTAAVSFTAPVAGTSGAVLKFQLTVDDGYGGMASDEIIVNVTYVNHPPIVSAGVAQTANEGTTVTLAGSASDPDGNDLTYSWKQVSGPAATLADDATLTPSFTAPLVTRAEADVVLRLTANDGYGGIVSSDVSVHIANINHAPTAQAPANLSVAEGTPVSLIGQGTDPDTEEQSLLAYSWQQTGGPAVVLSGSGANVSFTAPLVTAGGDPNAKTSLAFRLTVTDPNKASATDDVTVVVTNVDHAPTAIAGANLTVNEAASVTLNGSASSDPDGDALTYSWVQTAGPVVALSGAETAYPSFTAPFVNAAGATLKFKLTVNDGFGGLSSDTATVTVANINDPPTAANPQASVGTLWPPDHSMVKVSILGVVDVNNNATIKITGVTQDEATNGLGDGDTAIDAIINKDGTVLLRAERAGNGNGRVYHVHFTASDFEGSVSGVVKVSVPHDKKGDVAIDGGELFDSTR